MSQIQFVFFLTHETFKLTLSCLFYLCRDRFNKLKEQGDGVLEGKQLEEALQNLSISEDSALSSDKLR